MARPLYKHPLMVRRAEEAARDHALIVRALNVRFDFLPWAGGEWFKSSLTMTPSFNAILVNYWMPREHQEAEIDRRLQELRAILSSRQATEGYIAVHRAHVARLFALCEAADAHRDDCRRTPMDTNTTPADVRAQATLRHFKLIEWRGVHRLIAAGMDDPDDEGIRARIEELAILFTLEDRWAGIASTFGEPILRRVADATGPATATGGTR